MTAVEKEVKRVHPLAKCEDWQGAINPQGYGTIGGGAGKDYAHRVAWIKAHGGIPNGYEIHHVCGNRRCVNVEHMECITEREHREMRMKVCRNGHERTPENIKVIYVRGEDKPRHECIRCREARGI